MLDGRIGINTRVTIARVFFWLKLDEKYRIYMYIQNVKQVRTDRNHIISV